MALSILYKKPFIKNVLKLIISGLSMSFIAMLDIMLVHDTLTGTSSHTTEYCVKYSILASPSCW